MRGTSVALLHPVHALVPRPQTFGGFNLIRPLGRGGMGEVFIARTPWRDHPVAALKRLRPELIAIGALAKRLQHEGEIAIRLRHANIVRTLAAGEVSGRRFVCSELIPGKDVGRIADRLAMIGRGAPIPVAVRILIDGLWALAYIHSARDPDGRHLNLVHRDITPGNVLLGYDGVARIADFGLAKSVLTEGLNLTRHGEIHGTPSYLAPELIRGERAVPASDIYGLGAVAYRLLTGVAPYEGAEAEALFSALARDVHPVADFRPDMPGWLAQLTHRMLERSLTDRPDDASQLATALTARARAENLLLPRERLGRWLEQLFREEHDAELAEYRELARFPAAPPPLPVAVPRRRSGSSITFARVQSAQHRFGSGIVTELDSASSPAALFDQNESTRTFSRELGFLDAGSRSSTLPEISIAAPIQDPFEDTASWRDTDPPPAGPKQTLVLEERSPKAIGALEQLSVALIGCAILLGIVLGLLISMLVSH